MDGFCNACLSSDGRAFSGYCEAWCTVCYLCFCICARLSVHWSPDSGMWQMYLRDLFRWFWCCLCFMLLYRWSPAVWDIFCFLEMQIISQEWFWNFQFPAVINNVGCRSIMETVQLSAFPWLWSIRSWPRSWSPAALKILVGSSVKMDTMGMMKELVFMISSSGSPCHVSETRLSHGKVMETWPSNWLLLQKYAWYSWWHQIPQRFPVYWNTSMEKGLEVAATILVLAAGGLCYRLADRDFHEAE